MLTVLSTALLCSVFPDDRWPDAALWQLYPSQLLLVALVLRLRSGYAAATLIGMGVSFAWWCLTTVQGVPGLINAMFGPTAFLGLALLVKRVLNTIAHRRMALRSQESAALTDAAQRYVGLVQRTLWVGDLRAATSAILTELRDTGDRIPSELKQRCRRLEATLRESLVARNVMSEELADVTEAARRRGVDVRIVDSRATPLPAPLGASLLGEIRSAMRADTLSRIVVRVAPEGGDRSASIVVADGRATTFTTLDADGTAARRDLSG